MLRDREIEMELPTASDFGSNADSANDAGHEEWQDVDRELRSLARRQSGLDAELMRALREAERVQLWRHLGCVSMMEYLERVFGYGPRVAQERLRTARRLEELTDLADALERNELPFSAVRELTRVATAQTQATWRAAARGKSLREIEEMVAGLEPGDLPGERKRPDLMRVRLTYDEIETTTQALERQARQMLEAERGERIDDNAFLAAVFQLALGASSEEPIGGRPRFQIVHYQCDTCGTASQLGAGAKLPMSHADLEHASCDAEHVSLDAPARPTQDIPAKVRRFVELRDGKRCRIPGCRASRNLEIHHIEHQEDGGTHEPPNLILICGGHHKAHHRGLLWIAGTATNLVVKRFDEPRPSNASAARAGSANARDEVRPVPDAHVGAAPSAAPGVADRLTSKSSRYHAAEIRTNAITTLVTTGWDRKTSCAAVDSAIADLGSEAELSAVVWAALALQVKASRAHVGVSIAGALAGNGRGRVARDHATRPAGRATWACQSRAAFAGYVIEVGITALI